MELFLDSQDYPDLVLITEHWLKDGEPVHVPNYTLIAKFCRVNATHGGTLILIRDRVANLYGFRDFDKYDALLREKEFEFSIVFSKMLSVYVICLYRSPSTGESTFLDKLGTLLSGFSYRSNIILTGDFNLNFDNSDYLYTARLMNLLQSFSLTMHVDCPTRFSQYSSSILDYVCSNVSGVSCDVVGAALSDHEGVLCRFPAFKPRVDKRKQYGRIFSKTNFNRFSQMIEGTSWGENVGRDDPLASFHSLLVDIFSTVFPLKLRRRRHRRPWITKGLRTSGKNLRSLHYIRKFASPDNFIFSYYNTFRSIYRRLIRLAKQNYYKCRVDEACSRQRESWSIVNELRGKCGKSFEHGGPSSDEFNGFYCTIGARLSGAIASATDPMDLMHPNSYVGNTFFLAPTDRHELKGVFRGMKNRNACGWDGISLRIFLRLPDGALDALAGAINASFASGKFPDSLKLARVIPLHKGGGREDPGNFRPISLLPTLSKIIERLVRGRMLSFLNANGVLSPVQYGFQSGMGTSDAVFSLLDDLYLQLNAGEAAAAVFCDLSKAFDCVSHRVLLKKLGHYGFRGVSFGWFESYLSNRLQAVHFNGVTSVSELVTCGVPQGSVLGPILFLLYINDLAFMNIDGKFTLFADDTTVLWHGKDSRQLGRAIESDVGKIKQWCDSNLLSFNVKKTNILSFRGTLEPLGMGGQIVPVSECSKFLGLHIDGALSFRGHITHLCAILARGCFALRVVSRELDAASTRSVYFALIESHLRYGVCFWGSCSRTLFRSVFILQKRAIRLISGAGFRDAGRPLFLSNRILTLPSIFILETVCLMHKKHRHNIVGDRGGSGRDTRRSFCIDLPIPHSALIKRSVLYNSKKLFNHLPLDIRCLASAVVFKIKVKTLLLSRAYYTVEEYLQDVF